MNSRFTVLETSLNRAEFRWKWLRMVELSSVFGIGLSLGLLLLGTAVRLEWIRTSGLASTLFAILCAVGFVGWLLIAILVFTRALDRSWLAAAVERVEHRFLDRLNTLLFLEKRRSHPGAQSFAVRIARQTQAVLAEKSPPPAFSAGPSLTWFGAFAIALFALLALNHLFAPWEHFQIVQARKAVPAKAPEKPLDLALPATNSFEQDRRWGEVRITDPGVDLKVTKVDVVPLQIEAAANQHLKEVQWFSTVNNASEIAHPLPPPTEPRYAVYQPTFFLDELNLADWDVMTYYAKATTESSNVYASEMYFLEVRPFREDIAKIPGGEGGTAHQCLNELSGLINRQQHVTRQTHHHIQNPPEQENLRAQDRKKLAEAEDDLSDATRHLYAKMAAKMENKPIGEALDNLAKAEKSLEGASKQLQNNALPEAQNLERGALAELVAARKMFQKAISDDPDAFKDLPEDEEPPPVADSSKRINQMAEFRNESKAALDMVQKTLEQQRAIERQTRTMPPAQYPRLGDEQQKLQQALRDFQEQHPRVFKGSETEANDARQAMGKAAKSLQARNAEARNATQQASRELEELIQAMQNRSTDQQLVDAYKLKQMLDQQIRALEERSQAGSKMSDAELQNTGREAKQTVDQLKKVAEQEPTRDAFGQPLRDALSGQNKVDLDVKLLQLQLAEDEAAKQLAAGRASQSLAKVSDAFEASQPKALQMARQTDSLKPGQNDSFSQGMAELGSLIQRLQSHRQLSKEDQAKQGQQALADLQDGMRSQFGSNERGTALLTELERLLKAEEGLEPGNLQKLFEALQHFSVETSEQLAKKEAAPELSNVDPAHLPPAYRSRIQKYFQKLSER